MWKQGQAYEDFVADRLLKAGWILLARNQRYKGAELDIIARRAERLIFVEVKARRKQTDIQNLLSPRKLRSLARGIQTWLLRTEEDCGGMEVWLILVKIGAKPSWDWFPISDQIEATMEA